MPSPKTKRDRLAVVFGQDALALSRAVWAPGAPRWLREIEPVAFLRRMLVQAYYVSTDVRGREMIVKRVADKDGVPPGHLRLASPYDPDAACHRPDQALLPADCQEPVEHHSMPCPANGS
ncbi:hypothetical protein ACGFOM_14235 [Streptomyces sp. NPDC048594]|uniref:hypothetical protein n=1 Tax=Streptomyces sp. NPDC048594 TaxID=3365575 RepID=UPI003710834E